MKVRVLVVEDERQLADSIAEGLRHHAMAVDVAYDGEAGLDRATINDYDVLVLDRDIPLISGDEVCAALVQSESQTRILMLTAATAVAAVSIRMRVWDSDCTSVAQTSSPEMMGISRSSTSTS